MKKKFYFYVRNFVKNFESEIGIKTCMEIQRNYKKERENCNGVFILVFYFSVDINSK